jgi:hypothetical protein
MANKKGQYWTTETSNTIGEVNMETAELVKMKQTRVCHTQREFIKVFFDSISEITGGLEDGCYSVLFAIWKYSYFPLNSPIEGNKFNNDKGFKEEYLENEALAQKNCPDHVEKLRRDFFVTGYYPGRDQGPQTDEEWEELLAEIDEADCIPDEEVRRMCEEWLSCA